MTFKGWIATATLVLLAPSAVHAATEANFGAGAGLLGGLLVDRSRQAQDRAFQEGVAAGRQRQ